MQHINADEPYDIAYEPYTNANESYISTKSPIFLQMNPTCPQMTHVFLHMHMTPVLLKMTHIFLQMSILIPLLLLRLLLLLLHTKSNASHKWIHHATRATTVHIYKPYHIWTSYVTSYERGISHNTNESCHVWISHLCEHATYQRHMCKCGTPHMWRWNTWIHKTCIKSHAAYAWVMSHYTKESCHVLWITPHKWKCHICTCIHVWPYMYTCTYVACSFV